MCDAFATCPCRRGHRPGRQARVRPQRRYCRVMSASRDASSASDLTESVIALYGERTGPALALDAARAELEHLVAAAEIRREPPVWARSAALKPLDPVIVDTVAPLAAQRGRGVRTTCLGSTTPAPRRREQYSGGRSRGTASESTRRRAVR